MKVLRFVIALLLALVLHLTGVHLSAHFSLAFDLFLVVAVMNALGGNTLGGMTGGLVAGLLTDSLTGGLYGLHGLADTLVGYAVAFAAQKLVIQRTSGAMLVFVLAAAAQQALLAGVQAILLPRLDPPSYLWVLTRLGTTAALGVILVEAKRLFGGRVGSWKNSRRGKLRMHR